MAKKTKSLLLTFFQQMEKFQDPDRIEVHKQWDIGEVSRRFKGYWIKCEWYGLDDILRVEYDITHHYTRVLGEESKVPVFTQGKHIMRDAEFISK